eukprot:bmy_16764T0
MFPLQGAQMLQMLEKSLRKSLPTSLKDMTDDLDHYTNTYHIYSKDLKNCQEFLSLPEVINWKQHLQIQTPDPQPAVRFFTQLQLYLDQEMFKLSSLDPTHAAVVNKFWHFGGNEWSQRFIERCIRTFPNFCLLGPEGTPVSWSLMDQTGEMRMGGTLPEYRAHGLVTYVIYYQTQALIERGFPVYSHVDKNNKIMQKMSHSLNHIPVPCDWNQWNCVPL